jgi:hypothetical protein
MTGTARFPDTADPAIGCYLAAIAAEMPGPGASRRDILAELGSGLADAADGYRDAGLDPAQAALAAIDEFGSPDRVAAGFRAEMAAAQARRTAVGLIAVGPLTAAMWFGTAVASHVGRLAPPWEWAVPAAARLSVHLAIVALLVALVSTLLTLAATGRLTRWLDSTTVRPAASAALAATCLVGVEIAMLVALAILAATPGRVAVFPLAAAGAASLAMLGLAARAARACLALREPCPGADG